MESVILIVLVVLVLGAVGYIVLQAQNKNQNTTTPARPARPTPAASSPSAPGQGTAKVGAGSPHWLLGLTGDIKGNSYHIGERMVSLGRGQSNYVQVTDPNVSRVHVRFTHSSNGVLLKGMGDKKRTFVNGNPIVEYLLRDRDVIRVGDTEFEYYAMGTFEHNHGLGRKVVGKRVARATIQNNDSLEEMFVKALIQYKGDVNQAATDLQMPADLFVAMLEEKGINPDEYVS